MESLNETTRRVVHERTDSHPNRESQHIPDYYADYDPMVGIRIAISLGVLITLFTIFILYKTQCNARKTRRLFQASTRTRAHGFDSIEFRTRTFSNDTWPMTDLRLQDCPTAELKETSKWWEASDHLSCHSTIDCSTMNDRAIDSPLNCCPFAYNAITSD